MKQKLTSYYKKKITYDWNFLFPELDVYESMWLMKRINPILIGILLERDSSNNNYSPILHIHNLAKPFDTISLTLPHPLCKKNSNVIDKILVSHHEQKYKEAAEHLRNQTSLPLEGDLELNKLINLYYLYLRDPRSFSRSLLFEDIALIYSWANNVEKAIETIDNAKNEINYWPNYMKENFIRKNGEIIKWYEVLIEKVKEPEIIRKIVDSEIKKFKVENLPVSLLVN